MIVLALVAGGAYAGRGYLVGWWYGPTPLDLALSQLEKAADRPYFVRVDVPGLVDSGERHIVSEKGKTEVRGDFLVASVGDRFLVVKAEACVSARRRSERPEREVRWRDADRHVARVPGGVSRERPWAPREADCTPAVGCRRFLGR
jgi:hypothetical protein